MRNALNQSGPDADQVQEWANLAADCSKVANKNDAKDWEIGQAALGAVAARQYADTAYKNLIFDTKTGALSCKISGIDSKDNPTYGYKHLFPLVGAGCGTDAVVYYYQSGSKQLTFAGQAQYLYNAEQSTSQINADLMTATFTPGIQLVLAGTATVGSAQPATTSTDSPAGTDSVSTTVSKLQQGGDFNLRLQYPMLYAGNSVVTQVATFVPNVGFMVNGLSSQNTITSTTNYSLNVPIEAYGELHSLPIADQVPAVIYWDARYGGEWISDQLAKTANLPKVFGIGYLAFGVEFAKSIRIGGQYYFGPRAAYCVASTSGCTTPDVSDFKGLHFVVSFSTPKV